MSRVLYLLRHGQTVWNRAGRHQGQKDSPLTIQGIAQAEAMGRRLAAEVGPAASIAFFASPLGRCRQSAAIVADVIGFDPEAIDHDDRLKEITFGRWDGQTHDEIKAVDRAAWTARRADRWAYVPAGGESYAMVADRVAPFIAALPADGVFVVMGHGSMNRIFRGLWRGLEPADMLALDEPQDGFYRLDGNGETFIPA